MSRILMVVAIEDAAADPLGIKEAAAMALEPLGNAQVLEVNVQEHEQLSLDGAAMETEKMVYCMRCAHYRKQRGRDETGRPYWGVCQLTDSPVYRLSGNCKDWTSYII